MSTVYRVSVRGLVEHSLLEGDLSPAALPGRRLQGIRAHQRLQRARPRTYRKEVPVSLRVSRGEIELEILGRIDGIFEDPVCPVIEEIKSVAGGLEGVFDRPHFWGQVQVYAFIVVHQRNLEGISCRLTCYSETARAEQSSDRSFSRSELQVFFDQLIDHYVEWLVGLRDHQAVRNRSILEAEFPYEDYRPGQRELAVAIYRALKARRQVFVEAATGTGKTVATLFPALKAVGHGEAERVFFVTAKTTGQESARDCLDRMAGKGISVRAVTVTAREKVCLSPESACSGVECNFARDFHGKLRAIRPQILGRHRFDRGEIENLAREYEICPFFLSLEIARWSDCVICDYNYVFNPRTILRDLLEEKGATPTVLIDEAHNLVERSRDMFSATLSQRTVVEAAKTVRPLFPEVARSLGRISRILSEERVRRRAAGGEPLSAGLPLDLCRLSQKAVGVIEERMPEVSGWEREQREKLMDCFFSLYGFLLTAERFDSSYVTVFEETEDDFTVQLFCLDAGPQLAEALQRFQSAAFFSGTLTPANYFRRALGGRSESPFLTLTSPFPPENLMVFLSGGIDTRFRKREETRYQVAGMLQTLVRCRPGNYLLFFPSYEYLSLIAPLVDLPGDEWDVLEQSPSMSETERAEFIEKFRKCGGRPAVGFAVLGGVFGEAIDLVGEALSGVAVVTVGLPALGVLRERIRSHFDDQGVDGFDFAYRFPGVHRVLQACGRVIRSAEDKGVILLVDDRFLQAGYRRLLPSSWRQKRVSGNRDLEACLKEFWNGKSVS